MATIPPAQEKYLSRQHHNPMSLFGKKKDKSPKGPPAGLTGTINTIPDVFYGGADPVIHYASETARTVAPIRPVQKISPPPIGAIKKPPLPNTKKRTLFIALGGVFFLLFLGLTAWYYVGRVEQTPAPVRPIVRPAQPPPPEPKASPPLAEQPPPVAVPPPTSTIADRVGQFPRLLLTDTPDIDADTLTDEEETILGTDSGIWDTDADGYFDGQEVVNLYNPKGFAPIRLIDSGLVREYIHPRLQYRIYYPVGWEAAAVDTAGDQVIFSDASGDFVEVRALAKDPAESFDTWFGRVISGQQITDLLPFSSRFKEDGLRRKDNLTAYLDRGSTVYILVYHPAVEDAIRFRHLMMMMRESFRPE